MRKPGGKDIYKRPVEDDQIFTCAAAAVAELSKGKLAESTSSRHQHIYLSFFLNSQISISTDAKGFLVAVVKRNSLPCKRGQNRTAQCGSRE
jgi:hypothetical protein